LRPGAAGGAPGIVWHTQEGAEAVDYQTEPARSAWQRLEVNALSLLPMDEEL
jgi:putative cardiolipin synthase